MNPPPPASAFRFPLSAFQFLAAVPLVVVGTILLCQTIELALAARSLQRAADAAAMAATLPAADAACIQAAVRRSLGGSDLQDCLERPMIWIDGLPASANDLGHLAAGAEVSVFLSVQATDVAPDLLEALGISLVGHRLSASQICQKP